MRPNRPADATGVGGCDLQHPASVASTPRSRPENATNTNRCAGFTQLAPARVDTRVWAPTRSDNTSRCAWRARRCWPRPPPRVGWRRASFTRLRRGTGSWRFGWLTPTRMRSCSGPAKKLATSHGAAMRRGMCVERARKRPRNAALVRAICLQLTLRPRGRDAELDVTSFDADPPRTRIPRDATEVGSSVLHPGTPVASSRRFGRTEARRHS
jgi:hypothetical protein